MAWANVSYCHYYFCTALIDLNLRSYLYLRQCNNLKIFLFGQDKYGIRRASSLSLGEKMVQHFCHPDMLFLAQHHALATDPLCSGSYTHFSGLCCFLWNPWLQFCSTAVISPGVCQERSIPRVKQAWSVLSGYREVMKDRRSRLLDSFLYTSVYLDFRLLFGNWPLQTFRNRLSTFMF